jgi:hypothetical protein
MIGVVTIVLILCVQIFTLNAQNTQSFEITVFGNRLWVFDTATGDLTPVRDSNPFDRFDDPQLSMSPRQHYLISWERYPQLLEGGLLLTSLDEPENESSFSVSSSAEPHFATIQWPLGEKFAIVQVGIVTGGDPEYPNSNWMLDTNAWLIDIVEQTIEPWYWNCDSLILVEDALTLQDDSKEFAVQCTANLPPFAIETKFLTINGPRMAVDGPYHILYTRTLRYEVGWVFAPQMDQVAVVNHHLDGPLRDEILIYDQDGDAQWLTTFDTQTQPVLHLSWSPSGRYLAIDTGCSGLTISACMQIWDMQTNKVIWDSSRLGDTLSGTRVLDISSIYWLDGENEFFLLGKFYNENPGSYIWHLSLSVNTPLASWSVPSSLNYIIKVEPER